MTDKNAIYVRNVSKKFKLHNKSSIKTQLIENITHKKNKHSDKNYNNILKDVSLEVRKGDFFAIVGRNGSGKSTLLKIIAGIYSQDSGDVIVNGKLVPFIELGVGFNQELTGKDNIYLNGSLLGFTRKEVDLMYNDIVSFAELEDFMHEKLKNYSSGMQVRLAFSVAIRAKSEVMLIDEVLAVGDAAFQQKCFDYFEELKKKEITVVFVTHDMASVQRFCNKAAYIKDGKLVKVGSPSDISQIYINDNFGESESKSKNGKITNLPVKISLEILGSKSIDQGKKIAVQASLDSPISKEVVVSASILRNGFYVGGFNTKSDKKPITLKKGNNKLKIYIDTNSLGEGPYSVGFGVYKLPTLKPIGAVQEGPRVNIIENSLHKDGLANIDGTITHTGRN